jgi:hypothetical protein
MQLPSWSCHVIGYLIVLGVEKAQTEIPNAPMAQWQLFKQRIERWLGSAKHSWWENHGNSRK